MVRRGLGWFILFFLFCLLGIGHAEEFVEKITFLGNVRIEEGALRAAIKSREGAPFSAEQVREDLRSIFALGFFSDVQVDIKPTPKGKEIIFIVVEKPSIKDIGITGNQKVKYDLIKEQLTLTSRSILNLDKVKENAELIRKLYFSKGYYGVKVDYQVDYLETNEAVVTFRIVEGPKGHIKKILFKGNKKIKSSELKKVMQTKQRNIFSIITKTGRLDEDILKNDLQLLTAYYVDHGYLEAKVLEPKIDLSDPKKIKIEIEISEGPQYRIGEVDFKGDLLTTKEDLFKVIKIKRNQIYSNSALRRDVNALTEKFANQGYAYVEIDPETSSDPKNLLVHITFDIRKNKQVYYERIQIVGNTKTRDKVIRRELQFAEGELYSVTKMGKSRDRLRRTGFFKEVDFTTSRGSTDEKINLDIKVEEAPTGSLTFGIGYSSIEKVVGTASISDRNLFGLGYHGILKFSLGTETSHFKLSFTDPYFLGYNYAVGVDGYYDTVEIFSSYKYKILGGDLRVGKEIAENIRIDGMYKLEKINVYDVNPDASWYIKEQEGKKVTSAISLNPSMDTRDDYYQPSRGAYHSFFIQYAGGILGGDNYFVKATLETSWYFPMPLKTVLNLRGRFGILEPYSGKKAPVYEKFYVGGIRTVRGFEYGKAGPVDPATGDPIGAEKMFVINSELIFPIAREIGLKGAVFYDMGKGFDKWDDFFPPRHGAGVGIRWFSPFGPLRIDFGFNLNPKRGEKRHVLDFTVGTVF
jgi:outer membrane protein insertion porin family